MALTAYLSEYSLVEIFQFIQIGYKTGLLIIEPDNDSVQSIKFSSYIWFQDGRLVAHARDVTKLGLLVAIDQRGWISSGGLSNIHQQFKLIQQPLGLHLKSKGILDTEQLRLIFRSQVLQPVCQLFTLANAKFSFDDKAPLVFAEMTGLSVAASEASLLGLRLLKDWSTIEHKLPSPEFGLQQLSSELPSLTLHDKEIQVWELANGQLNIAQIAQKTGLEITLAQQISFRLAAVGLVKEVALEQKRLVVPETILAVESAPITKINVSKPALSKSFLGNLVGFLKKKG